MAMKRPKAKKNHLPPGIALAWGLANESRRGPKPGHTLEEIVDIAIRLADQQGLSALSLPSIAALLGLSRNALYRYVRSKNELLVVVYDAAWGSPPKSLFRTGGWRKKVRAWTLAVVQGYRTHSWLLDVPIAGSPATPNVLKWLEALLRSLSRSGLDADDCLRCALLLDGYARSIIRLSRDVAAGGQTQKQADAINAFLLPLVEQRQYSSLSSIMINAQHALKESPLDDVEFGLKCILDGIGRLIESRKA